MIELILLGAAMVLMAMTASVSEEARFAAVPARIRKRGP
jgi:hypothetical protein